MKNRPATLGNANPDFVPTDDMKRRFFKSYAVFYAQYISLEDKIKSVREQEHSVNEYRVNGILNNIDDWYSCFDVTSGQQYYLSPESRVHFW